ncbi:hypothetical protein CRG98_002063 [Punica granatum]|uniref:Cold and drought-regulated protein CORA-like n=1 Tax=Punica granatum TaxID=22663 RepID=A0A2I0L9U0_PUNGR|nr:hypothetical protein CRG98_002063 [Punica granatum]
MAPSKVLLLLGLAFLAIILVSSEAVSARELAETTETGYGHGKGHGGYGHGKGHGGYGHGKGHGGYGHGKGHDDGHH